jgi:hypothetical protein
MHNIPLQSLLRANYTPDSTSEKSTTFVRQDTYPIVPDKSFGMVVEYLEDNTNQDMNVNGSVTPAEYIWNGPDTELVTYQVYQIRLVIVANNITNFLGFANGPALTNGIDIIAINDAGTFPYANIKTNVEFVQVTTDSGETSFEQQGNNTQDGILFIIRPSSPLLGASGLSYKLVVNDDLTGISYMRASVIYEIFD